MSQGPESRPGDRRDQEDAGGAAALSGAAPAADRRLLWRCRRGRKELDLLLARFARERCAGAAPGLRRAFEELLELPDPELAAWLLGQAPPDPRFRDLIAAILAPDSK